MDQKRAFDKLAAVSKDRLLLVVAGILVLVLAGFAFYNSLTPEWAYDQNQFRTLVEQKFGPARAATAPRGLQQIYVKDLNRTDRCLTCHQGVEWKGLENAPEPFRTHPKEILTKHPLLTYGCTICHGGQGYATTYDDAHGPVEQWEEPVLGTDLAGFYVLSNKQAMLQLNCNLCHRYDKHTDGADAINHAKDLVTQKGCRACHVINGRGGTVGPDLTWEGSKSAEQFNYERIQGLHSEYSWHIAHFKDPKSIVPTTVMPNFGFTSAEAQALALMVMSWKKEEIPVQYLPNNNFRDIPSKEELEREERMKTGPGAFFVNHRCFLCHSISTFGVEAAAQIGPDLAVAVQDVQSRFGRTLDDFLHNPTGTMQVVLSTMIMLTPAERDQAISLLREANKLKLQQTAAAKK